MPPLLATSYGDILLVTREREESGSGEHAY